MSESLRRFLPAAEWLPRYRREDLRGDLSAGLTTAVLLIPQGMAYAMLAGLPPIMGLYASIVPLVIYAIFGSSRQLAVGPVAMVSLLVASGVGMIAEQGTEAYWTAAILLAAMVGVFQLVMGIGRMGFLTNFLSHPVISGFTSAAALTIGFSQLKHLLGVDIPRSHQVHEIVVAAVSRAGEIEPLTLLLGAGSVVFLLLARRLSRSFPAALAVVVLGTAIVSFFGLDARGVAIVGAVPAGLPSPALPTFDPDLVAALWPTALAIALVGFMESISVARAFARRNRYEVDANQELTGLGLANLAGSLFGAYPVTGGFSRTAVNAEAGANTGLASILTAAIIAMTLLLLTPLFHFLPKAVLAAIIMVAVFGLVDLEEVRHLWKVKRSDLALLLLTFASTLLLGIEEGILVGVGASILWFVVRTTRPHTAVLGRLPGTETYRNLKNFPEARTIDGMLIVRVDAQFYFGNMTFLKSELRRLEAAAASKLRAVVIEASSINQLDSSADAALHEIAEDYENRGIRLFFADVKGPVAAVMERSGFRARLGEGHFFLELHDAVVAAGERCCDVEDPATIAARPPTAPARALDALPSGPPSEVTAVADGQLFGGRI